jgi:hypothetical protein
MTHPWKKKCSNQTGVDADNESGNVPPAISHVVAIPESTAGAGSNDPASIDSSREGDATGDPSLVAHPDPAPTTRIETGEGADVTAIRPNAESDQRGDGRE